MPPRTAAHSEMPHPTPPKPGGSARVPGHRARESRCRGCTAGWWPAAIGGDRGPAEVLAGYGQADEAYLSELIRARSNGGPRGAARALGGRDRPPLAD